MTTRNEEHMTDQQQRAWTPGPWRLAYTKDCDGSAWFGVPDGAVVFCHDCGEIEPREMA